MKVAPFAKTLERDESADTVVVGSGIAGLSTACELAARGQSVIVLDRGPIGSGMTARTTAHLTSLCDDTFENLITRRGVDVAKQFYLSQARCREPPVCPRQRPKRGGSRVGAPARDPPTSLQRWRVAGGELALCGTGSPWPSRQSLRISSPAKKACDPWCAGTTPLGAPAGVGSASLCSASVCAKR